MTTPVRLYDSFRRDKVPFEPLVPGKVGMYVCGPTTYTAAHIGHAYSAISFDTIRRSLLFLGYDVRYVRNVTDIDDKIINAANEAGRDAMAMSAHYAEEYNRDMALFHVMPPTVEPKVTGHIPQIVALVQRLIETGKAYASQGDVYYSVASFPDYGKLSLHTQEDDPSGEHARAAANERKRAPHDFALWKAAKPGEPSWESPWGKGRPGWHIECSAMTEAHLGTTFDLHAGGSDLKFPHHENEIAQSQGAFGPGTFARHWMHNGFLNFAGEKMSRSLGNVVNAVEVARQVGGEAFRFYCAKHHYAAAINFEFFTTRDGAGKVTMVRFFSLEAADRELAYFYTTLARIDAFAAQGGDGGDGQVTKDSELLVPAAREALADDFNSPVAMAAIHDAARHVNKLLDENKGDKQMRRRSIARVGRDLRAVGAALGLFTQVPSDYLAARRSRLVDRKGIDVAAVQGKIADRTAARAAKEFERADQIRKDLAAMSVELHDAPGGTEWSVLEVGSD
nr:cysteine--tRNA ligase [Kofleriaceae bacterium]